MPKMYDFHWSNAKYMNPSRATIPLIRPRQCDSDGGHIRGVLLYLSRYSRQWYSQKNIFQPEVFFSNLQTSSLKFVNSKKLFPVGIFFFSEYHCLEYRDK